MPDWLINDEKYTPQSGGDAFIDRSVFALIGVLSKLGRYASGEETSNQNTAVRLVFVILILLAISVSHSLSFVIATDVILLVLVSLKKAEKIVRILKNSGIAVLFTFAVLFPSAIMGNKYSLFMVTLKVFATVTVVNIFFHATRWHQITRALKKILVPDIFIFVLDITVRYIVRLGEFALNMFYSLKLRSVGVSNKKYASLSGIAGTIFIKSMGMAEEMYSAMECRGFTGEYSK